MILRLEHIGIAVKNLEDSNAHFEKLLGIAPYKEEEVVSEHVKTSFLQTGEAKIELLEATHPDSAIAKYLEKKPEGLHHIAKRLGGHGINGQFVRVKPARARPSSRASAVQ